MNWRRLRISLLLYWTENNSLSLRCCQFNPLNAELNPICKSHLAELFCAVFQFCSCFSKTLKILRTKRDKFEKQKAFCGEGNRHWSDFLKNAVISLLPNGEDNFLKKTCKYPFSFTYIVVEALSLFDIDIFINCSWVVTRWQYTFTHKQYTEQHK